MTICSTGNESMCCICLCINSETDSIMLSCNHILHKDCLYEYMLNNYRNKETFNTCPICRKLISTNIQQTYIYNNVNQISASSLIIGGYILFNVCSNIFHLINPQ